MLPYKAEVLEPFSILNIDEKLGGRASRSCNQTVNKRQSPARKKTDESCGSDLTDSCCEGPHEEVRKSNACFSSYEPSCPFQSQELIGPVLQLVSPFSALIPFLTVYREFCLDEIVSRGLCHNVFKPYSD